MALKIGQSREDFLGLKLHAIASFLISSTVLATDLPLEIKGLGIGNVLDCTTLNDVDVRSGAFHGRSSPDGCWPKGDKIGGGMLEVSFLGKSDQALYYVVRPDGIVALVSLTAEASRYGLIPWKYDDAVAAFTEKYGEPEEVTVGFAKNAFGAEFPQRSATWKNGSQTLRVGENLRKVGKHSVELSDPTLEWKSKASDDI